MKKPTKTKSLSTTTAVGQDIVGLITTLVQKITSFETKMDVLLSRTAPRPFEPPRQQPMPAPLPQQHRDTRPMHKAICADCHKECEVPFRPSGDRPVYCKECFTKRKNNGTFKPRGEGKPKEGPVVQVRPPEKPQAVKPAKPVGKKKPAAKKKKKKSSK